MNKNKVIEFKDVNKSFGRESVLKSVTISFEKGKIYGICGRNGSGKTVFMKLSAGFLKTTSGEVWVQGKQIGKDCDFPEKMGIMIEHPGFLKTKSGFSNLKFLAEIRNEITDEEIHRAMEVVGLDWKEKKWVGRYSMGMRQRLGIAQAIMEKPEILLLDEPINGLDTEGANEVRNLLKRLRDEGTTILLASHLREDLEEMCDEIYYLADGKLNHLTL